MIPKSCAFFGQAHWWRKYGAKRRIGFSGWEGRELSTWLNNELVAATTTHVIDRNLELLRSLGITAPDGSLRPARIGRRPCDRRAHRGRSPVAQQLRGDQSGHRLAVEMVAAESLRRRGPLSRRARSHAQPRRVGRTAGTSLGRGNCRPIAGARDSPLRPRSPSWPPSFAARRLFIALRSHGSLASGGRGGHAVRQPVWSGSRRAQTSLVRGTCRYRRCACPREAGHGATRAPSRWMRSAWTTCARPAGKCWHDTTAQRERRGSPSLAQKGVSEIPLPRREGPGEGRCGAPILQCAVSRHRHTATACRRAPPAPSPRLRG